MTDERQCPKCRGPMKKGRCGKCRNERRQQLRKANPEKRNAAEYAWRRAHPGRAKATRAKWAKAHPELNKQYARNSSLKYNYGMTLEEYDQMLEAQGGVCALCGKPPTTKRLAVDHDHVTNKVRGLIHSTCNLMLGTAQDDPLLLHAAIRYLALHGITV